MNKELKALVEELRQLNRRLESFLERQSKPKPVFLGDTLVGWDDGKPNSIKLNADKLRKALQLDPYIELEYWTTGKITQDTADTLKEVTVDTPVTPPFYIKAMHVDCGYSSAQSVPSGAGFTEHGTHRIHDGDPLPLPPTTGAYNVWHWAFLRFGNGTNYVAFEPDHHGARWVVFPFAGWKIQSTYFTCQVRSVGTGVINWGRWDIFYWKPKKPL